MEDVTLMVPFPPGTAFGTDWTVHPICGLSPPLYKGWGISSPKSSACLHIRKQDSSFSSPYNPVHLRYSSSLDSKRLQRLEAI